MMFKPRVTVEQVEEGRDLAPKFENGLIPVVTTDIDSGELLMHAYMNSEALEKTITSGEAHYYSRSRNKIWHKGAVSGFVQKVVEIRVDDDQDCIWLKVQMNGAPSCHVGYRSCFYRKLSEDCSLIFCEKEKIFIPEEVYHGLENPTKL